MNLRLEWTGGLQFRATNSKAATGTLDSDGLAGFSPMESLRAALCGCMAVDVVTIVQKMRHDLKSLEVVARAERNPDPPRFFRKIELVFSVSGTVPPDRVEQAVRLSFDRYRSVFHTLRKDIEVTHRIECLDEKT